jgi:hypothetical protein
MILFLNVVPAHGQQEAVLTLNCDKDAYVDERESGTNFGSTSTVLVRSRPNENARALFGFPFDRIPPGSVVLNASLTVYINQSAYSSRKYVVSRLDQQWNESEVKWSNQPWWGQDCDRKSFVPGMTELTFDVTTVIRQYSSMGWPLTGFLIKDDMEYDWRGQEMGFTSRENPTQLGAILNVTISYAPDIMLSVMPDRQDAFPGDAAVFHYLLASLNQWEGTVQLAVQGLASTMRAVFDSETIQLRPGEGRYGEFSIVTTISTPPNAYNLLLKGNGTSTSSETTVRSSGFTLQLNPMILLRGLPSAVQNNTDFPVTLTYYTGTLNANSFVMEERLPEWTNLTFIEGGEPNITMPNTSIHSYAWKSTDGGQTTLKILIANATALNAFDITYWVHFSFRGNGSMPTSLNFNGQYTYMMTDGKTGGGQTLGQNNVEIPIGLPYSYDDDGRVDDWEIIEVIHLWIQGRLSDEHLLAYIALWQRTTINVPPPP